MFKTDLAHELLEDNAVNCKGVTVDYTRGSYGLQKIVTRVVSDAAAKELGKPIGTYCTVECKKFYLGNQSVRDYVQTVFEVALKQMILDMDLKVKSILLVGLGNAMVGADSLGNRVINLLDGGKNIQLFCPSVMGKTGVESSKLVACVCGLLKPDLVIAIDSLASRECERIGTSFQINNTGIIAGSGVGQHGNAITSATIGCPIIAVGVPMITYAASLVYRTIEGLKLKVNDCNNSRKLDSETNIDFRLLAQINDQLDNLHSPLHIVPKEIDFVVEDCSQLIKKALTGVFKGLN